MSFPPSSSPDAMLDAALELDSSAREAFIVDACRGNAALLSELRKMIAAYEAMPNAFLALPAMRGTEEGESDPKIRTDAGIEPAAEHPGQMIGHYKLREQIGEGGLVDGQLSGRHGCDSTLVLNFHGRSNPPPRCHPARRTGSRQRPAHAGL